VRVGQVLLEVEVAHERDLAGAVEGGADRLHVRGEPGPALVSGICHATDLPVFVPIGDDPAAAVARAEPLLDCGATGVVFGFLDGDLEVDVAANTQVAEALYAVPWVFSEAIDGGLDARRSWRRVVGLPGVLNVCSAGSPRGLGEGYDDLLATAESDPAIAALLMAGTGLQAEQVPWLVRAGLRAFHLGAQVRPGGSDRAYVDAGLVRSWRLLLDDALNRV
jgi:copper homeostasis protein